MNTIATSNSLTVEDIRSRIAHFEANFTASTIGDFLSRYTRQYAERTAVHIIETGEELTYGQLDLESNRIANALLGVGIKVGDRVAVMLGNRITFPTIWAAVAKIGAVLVPINMRYTPREVEYVVADSGAQLAILDQKVLDVFGAMEPWPDCLSKEAIVVIGQDVSASSRWRSFEAFLADYDTTPPQVTGIGSESLMNIQYTSGTTGFPKGCMLTHDYWLIFSYQGACWEPRPLSRYMTAQPFFYVDPQWLFLKVIRNGATLFIAPQLSSSRFMGWAKKFGIQWCHVPELVGRQPAEPDDEVVKLEDVPGFGWGSETSHQFKRRFPGVRTGDGFAMTEIGFGTQRPFELENMFDSGSVGIAAPFRSVRVVKEDGSEAGAGETGEAWIKGRSIFRGYWKREEANAEAFVGEWFRTGDLFRTDGQGFYWLVGRVKEMIRRSNENIAAREVEAVIREVAEVEDVAAVAVKDVMRGEEVKIYVQARDADFDRDALVTKILARARTGLAAFKVPRYIEFVPEFPRTISNKIVKRKLNESRTDQMLNSFDAQDNVWR